MNIVPRVLIFCGSVLMSSVVGGNVFAEVGQGTIAAQPIAAQPIAPQIVAQIPGWNVLQGRGVELALPADYRGGNPTSTEFKALLVEIKKLGSNFAQAAELAERNPNIFVFFAINTKETTARGVTNVLVASQQLPETVNLTTLMDAVAKSVPAGFRVVDRKVVSIAGKQAGRLVVEAQLQGESVQQLTYISQQDKILSVVAYTTSKAAFQRQLPIFERSIQTFKRLPGKPS
jgi:hypothetical protein